MQSTPLRGDRGYDWSFSGTIDKSGNKDISNDTVKFILSDPTTHVTTKTYATGNGITQTSSGTYTVAIGNVDTAGFAEDVYDFEVQLIVASTGKKLKVCKGSLTIDPSAQ